MSSDVLVPTLAYHVSGDDLLVFVHRDDGVLVRRLPAAVGRLHRLLDDLDDQWSRAAIAATHGHVGSAGLARSARATLRALHDLLVEPVEDALADLGPRLCVVPDGEMGTVPFPVLFDGEDHLFERWTITLAPEPAVGRQRRPGSCRRHRAVTSSRCRRRGRARVRPREAQRRRGPLRRRGRCWRASTPPSRAVHRRRCTGADVVHVACHGLHQPHNPLFSRLRLHDRWMPSAEIVQLDLDGALVVLSACQSGTHGRHREPVGLAWAFLAAGAAGAVVCQWHVADAATATVMASLHAGLVAGLPADEALRSAQREAAAAELHPYFWGAFALVVEPGPRRARCRRTAV